LGEADFDNRIAKGGNIVTSTRRQILYVAAGAAVLLAAPGTAAAPSWPARPVRLIVGFAPGGATDIVARIIAQWLSERLGQQVIVENRTGAGSNIAAQAAISSPPDGYTLLVATGSNAVNATFYDALPFDFVRDTAAVAGLVSYPLVLVVNPSVPAGTVAEFIGYAKANAGKIGMASYGTGSTGHMAGELFKAMTGLDMVHVPYRGEAPAMADIIGGQVQMMFATGPGSIEHIKSGRLRALAVSTATRWDHLPLVPPLGETVAGYEAMSWSGIVAPRGTPPQLTERLSAEIAAGLANHDIKARLEEIGATPMIAAPAEFASIIADETRKWANVVKRSGAKGE
jgi:tripartite-type tricarboxylate transporter receptor subunit TctC